MQINIQNNGNISNKYIRWIKWKLYQLESKFSKLLFVEVSIDMEGHGPAYYSIKMRFGLSGSQLVIKKQNVILSKLLHSTVIDAQHQLSIWNRKRR